MSKDLSRRDVLRGSAVAVAGLTVVGKALAESPQYRTQTKSDRLRFGIIGCEGKGSSGMEAAAQHGDIVAICDVDAANRSKGMLKHPKASSFDDYRLMFETMRGKLDAVVISIPDHHHAIASAFAMRAGIHTYCEKPLCRTIWEARQIAKIARDKHVATQMGNQSTANTPMRKMAALIKSGHYGHVKEVHLWTNRASDMWAQGVPRPEDFGTGALGDMGCHIFNMPHMALDLGRPMAVQATTSGHNKETFPKWSIVKYEYAKLGERPPFTVTWYDGGRKPDPDLAPEFNFPGNGVIVICEKGTIYSPNENNMEYHLIGGGEIPDIAVDESPGHMAEFARAAMGGKPAVSNFPNYAGPLAEAVLIGNLAIWANGPRLEWDADKMQVKGTTEYDSLIRPAYRKGYGV
jgi:predicted dehydrogenase